MIIVARKSNYSSWCHILGDTNYTSVIRCSYLAIGWIISREIFPGMWHHLLL